MTTAVSPLSFTKAVRDGFAELIAAESNGALAWDSTADYPQGTTGLWTSGMPTTVDRAVVVSVTQLSADATLSNALWQVKFRARGARNGGQDDADGLIDLIENLLGGRFPLTLPTGVRVSSLVYAYGGSLGVDKLERWQSSTNWNASVGRPGAHRN